MLFTNPHYGDFGATFCDDIGDISASRYNSALNGARAQQTLSVIWNKSTPKVKSIAVGPGVQLRVYKERDYEGNNTLITENTPSFHFSAAVNDRFWSFKIVQEWKRWALEILLERGYVRTHICLNFASKELWVLPRMRSK